MRGFFVFPTPAEAQPLVYPALARRAVGVATDRQGGRRGGGMAGSRVAASLGRGAAARAPGFRAGVDTAHLYPPRRNGAPAREQYYPPLSEPPLLYTPLDTPLLLLPATAASLSNPQ